MERVACAAGRDVYKRQAQGHSTMPTFGWTPVTVPGAVKAWKSLNERFGKLTLAQCLAPAIRYAQEGYPCSPVLAHYWQAAFDKYKKEFAGKPEFDEWFATFAPQGQAPQAGDVITLKNHAETLDVYKRQLRCVGRLSARRCR